MMLMVALIRAETSRSSGRSWIVVGGSTTTGSIGRFRSVWGSRLSARSWLVVNMIMLQVRLFCRKEYHWHLSWLCCRWSRWWLCRWLSGCACGWWCCCRCCCCCCCWPSSGHRAWWLQGLQRDGILIPENILCDKNNLCVKNLSWKQLSSLTPLWWGREGEEEGQWCNQASPHWRSQVCPPPRSRVGRCCPRSRSQARAPLWWLCEEPAAFGRLQLQAQPGNTNIHQNI